MKSIEQIVRDKLSEYPEDYFFLKEKYVEHFEKQMEAEAKIKQLEAKLSIAVEALEFYADRNGEQDWPQDAIQALEKLRGEK